MSVLNKLLKTTEGLAAEVEAHVLKNVTKAGNDAKKAGKTILAAAVADAKAAGHAKETKAAVLSVLAQLKADLFA